MLMPAISEEMSVCKVSVNQYRVTLSDLSSIHMEDMTNNSCRKDQPSIYLEESYPLNQATEDVESTIQIKSPISNRRGEFCTRPPLYSELNRSNGLSSGGPGSGGGGGVVGGRKYRLPLARSAMTYTHSDAFDGLVFVLSAIYSKIIVIIGLCFPMAEVISHRIPIGWYEGFYLYLYLGSIMFLLLIYMFRDTNKKKLSLINRAKTLLLWSNVEHHPAGGSADEPKLQSSSTNSSLSDDEYGGPVHFGSFYLRLGAVAFGIGSMIYSGLEFGQYFELESKEQCYSFLYGFTPTAHMTFTFFQLYFIFMNSKAFISKHNYIGKLMKFA